MTEILQMALESIFWVFGYNSSCTNRFSNPARFWKGLLKCYPTVPVVWDLAESQVGVIIHNCGKLVSTLKQVFESHSK
jgi:hypothetical protein